MQRYIFKRFIQSVIALWLISMLIFVLVRLSGDPAYTLLGADAPPEAREAFRKEWALDRPMVYQYGIWLARAFQGDFGEDTSALSKLRSHL